MTFQKVINTPIDGREKQTLDKWYPASQRSASHSNILRNGRFPMREKGMDGLFSISSHLRRAGYPFQEKFLTIGLRIHHKTILKLLQLMQQEHQQNTYEKCNQC